MGLSDEERMTKYLWSMKGWRKRLVELKDAIDRKEEDSKAVVDSWIAKLDLLTGRLFMSTNRSSTYWIFGEGDGSVANLLSQDYDLNVYAEPDSYAVLNEVEYETVRWWQNNLDHAFLVSRLQGHPFTSHEGVNALAKWWDAYAYWSAIMYPVWRYDDNLFPPEIREGLMALCGEMLNRRFEVCFPAYGGTSDEDKVKLELFMLTKLRAAHLLLNQETKGWKGNKYFKKKYPGYALLERVGKMSAKDLKDLFEKERERKWAWERKYHKDEEAKKVKKESGIIGPVIAKEEDPWEQPTKKTKKKRTSGKGSPTPAVTAPSGPNRKTTRGTAPAPTAAKKTASPAKT